MVHWSELFSSGGQDRHKFDDDVRHLLHAGRTEGLLISAYPAKEVTRIALRLKYQVEQVIPIEIDQGRITKANSPVITQKVLKTAKEAGGKDYPSCIIYCLLVCKRWFHRQAMIELWDADLHEARAVACETIAKKLIEDEEDEEFLLQELLLKRYSIIIKGKETKPTNAIERAVDLHALRVIASSGYQKCISYLWKGWLIQDDNSPGNYIDYKNKTKVDYWSHLNPDRMRTPQYQSAVQIGISFIYLVLYTIAINTINSDGDLDIIEGILYIFTAGFIFDEVTKLWKVGRYYLGFWNVFNSTLYALLLTSFITRIVALASEVGSDKRIEYNILSYNFLAFSAPFFWMRILLYLDNLRFFGAMLVILKTMMRESIIFFLLLIVISVGFLQAFIGLNSAQGAGPVSRDIIKSMTNALLQSPEFDGFDDFSPPFGMILYYLYTFIMTVILLNILVALYNSAYENVTDNADDEYMHLFALKTLQFVRAPDENVFIAPFNLIELFGLILPFEWWLPKSAYERLNNYVMGFIYSPMLLITAWLETRSARVVVFNRQRGESDDDTVEEWEQLIVQGEVDPKADGWEEKVDKTKPDVSTDATVVEVRELKARVEKMGMRNDELGKKVDELLKLLKDRRD